MNASDLRKGQVIRDGGEFYVVTDVMHITPGNWRGYVQAEFRGIKRGNKLQKRYRSNEDVDEVFVESMTMEYLYPEGDNLIFMDLENYEQIPVSRELLGDAVNYMKLNDQVSVRKCDGEIVSVELPATVVLTVTEAEPGVRGDSRSNISKNAKVDTGLNVRVPLYISAGERVRIDTRTGEFVERVNN